MFLKSSKNQALRPRVLMFLIIVASFVIPSITKNLSDASSPRFDPSAFGLPHDASEVVRKRTDKTATFEIERGKFAQVSRNEHRIVPKCLSRLCAFIEPIRNILPRVFAEAAGPNSPGTMATSNASGGTYDWAYPNDAKVEDGIYTYAVVGSAEDSLFPDTLIFTINGNKPIKDLKSGELVYSYNFEKRQLELKIVSNVRSTPISLHDNTLYQIYFDGGEIEATDNHLFYANNDLIRVKDLNVGDSLIGFDGEIKIIENIIVNKKENIEVWNFSVDGNHNYFAEGILVHNIGTYDQRVRIIKGGAVSSTDRASANAWSDSFAYTTYGSSSDKWGETWTSSDINASDFGVAISAYGSGYWSDATTYYLKATNFGFSILEGATIDGITVEIKKRAESGGLAFYASVDHMRITVYYTAAVAEAVPFFSWWSVPLMILGVVWLMRREGNFLMNHAS